MAEPDGEVHGVGHVLHFEPEIGSALHKAGDSWWLDGPPRGRQLVEYRQPVSERHGQHSKACGEQCPTHAGPPLLDTSARSTE